MNLTYFNRSNLYQATTKFFEDLQIPLEKVETDKSLPADYVFKHFFKANESPYKQINDIFVVGKISQKAFENNLAKFDLSEISTEDNYKDGILIFAIDFIEGFVPNKSQMIQLTRNLNVVLNNFPIVLLCKYQNLISLANAKRSPYQIKIKAQKDQLIGEKVGKVSIIKDINIEQTHAGHQQILNDLKAIENSDSLFAKPILNYEQLYKKWLDVFDLKILGDQFYLDIAKWYHWALPQITFREDVNKLDYTLKIITRTVFIWFLKEKSMIEEYLFDRNTLSKILNDFSDQKSTFYKAILQTLFFGVLNEKIENRFQNFDQQINFSLWYKDFDLNKVKTLFAKTPFINGGLFDGSEAEKPNKNQNICNLNIPNQLFFGEKQNVDLSKEFGNSKKFAKTSVKGLIDILHSYKFTVEENTLLESEVALDPEFLGRIFENLLAVRNPETGDIARKATGSFYTPREIVDYMVDESLKTYLSLDDFEKLDNLEQNQKRNIISKLEKLKILDPACGSGAFPMGILHRIVWILKKIDPQNLLWFESFINSFPAILQPDVRKKYKNENLDYLRKLGVILNSIYGIDIQPIAVQIAKLRCFLSLIIEQKTNQNKDDNFGIKILPNLEFKFVSANTLINAPELPYETDKLDIVLEDFANNTRNYFSANDLEKTQSKSKIEGNISQIVDFHHREIKRLIDQKLKKEKEGKKTSSAQIEQTNEMNEVWNSFGNIFKEKTVDFFQTKFFFPEITEGFDIVIGNPPYVNVEKIDKSIKNNISQFKTAYQKYDLYVLFYEKALNLLKENGILNFITSNKFLSQAYGLKIRQEFLKNQIHQIVNFNYDIFESATVRTCIFQLSKNLAQKDHAIKVIDINSAKDKKKFEFKKYVEVPQHTFQETEENNFRINLSKDKIILLKKIQKNTLQVFDICSVNYGLRPSSEKLNLKKEDFIFAENPNKTFKKYFEGKDMGYWLIDKSSFLDYNPDVMYNAMFAELFENEKLVGLRTLSDIGKLRFIYDDAGMYCNDSVVILTLWHKLQNVAYNTIKRTITPKNIATSLCFSYQYLQAILNSKLIKFYVNELMYDGTHFYPNHMKVLPIKNISKEAQAPFIALVDQILSFKKLGKSTQTLESELDLLVFDLYGLNASEIDIVLS